MDGLDAGKAVGGDGADGGNGGRLKVLSLFTGCGGMDLGFEGGFDVPAECVNRAMHPDWVERDDGNGWVRLKPTGFRTVFANDIKDSARRIWVRNFVRRGHTPGEFHLGSVVDLVKAHRKGEFAFPNADVVTGGWPCIDYSLAGKRMGMASDVDHLGRPMAPDTPANENRGMLYWWMREAISIVRPKVFVGENVGALANLGDALAVVRSDFSAIGYEVFIRPILGPAFGVPQTRERIIFIGIRRDALAGEVPDPHPARTHGGVDMPPQVTAGQALGGLPEPSDSDDPSQRAVSGARHLAPTAKHPKPFQGQKEVALDRPAPTIRADHHGHIEFRRLSIEHGGKHADELAAGLPERRLSVRECGRLQTFPDDFELVIEGDKAERVCKTDAYRAVGNAVPPLMAYAIAMRLREVWASAFGVQAAVGDGAEDGNTAAEMGLAP